MNRKTQVAIKKVALVFNPAKISAQEEKPRLLKWLKKHRIGVLSSSKIKQADTILTFGGDGTILAIAPLAARFGIPVMGINVGRLGFMTAIERSQLYQSLGRWIEGKFSVSHRMMLEVSTKHNPSPVLALNDAVIRIGSTTRVTTLSASIMKNNLGQFVGDGVIVATSTGSTAYSMAAQGPIVHPDIDALILTPICAHSFTQRPVVFPSYQTLELQLLDRRKGNEVQLCLDGQRVFLLKYGDKVRIRGSQFKLKLMQDPRVSYFELLREKLLWGGR